MTASEPSPSTPSPREAHLALRDAYATCRAGTYALVDDLAEDDFRTQPHPEFSPAPAGIWGHIAYTEAKWAALSLRGRAAAISGIPCHLRRRWPAQAPSGGRKLPPKDEVIDYVQDIRGRTIGQLDEAALRALRAGLAVRAPAREPARRDHYLPAPPDGRSPRRCAKTARRPPLQWIAIPAGPAAIGCDGLQAYDNEGPVHDVVLGDFSFARHPVTQAQFARFIEAGGYRERRWWDEDGWSWLAEAGVSGPLYWRRGLANHPVVGVSAFEAEAFARFSNARLPSEAEWEKAASWNPDEARASAFPWGEALPGPETSNCDRTHRGTTPVDRYPAGRSAYGVEDMMGNVWEWTSSVFRGYDGFQAWPYEGYSQAYFDGAHRVLRGGSWATRPWTMRASFRNWYLPGIRQILAGFRLARDGLTELTGH